MREREMGGERGELLGPASAGVASKGFPVSVFYLSSERQRRERVFVPFFLSLLSECEREARASILPSRAYARGASELVLRSKESVTHFFPSSSPKKIKNTKY